MVFKSEKGTFFKLIILLGTFIVLAKMTFKIMSDKIDLKHFIGDIFFSILLGYLIWIYFDTKYELTKTELRYKSGLTKGKIKLDKIKTVEIGKYLLKGTRVATSHNGLTLRFNDKNEIYISPENNELFIKQLIKLNNKIKVL